MLGLTLFRAFQFVVFLFTIVYGVSSMAENVSAHTSALAYACTAAAATAQHRAHSFKTTRMPLN